MSGTTTSLLATGVVGVVMFLATVSADIPNCNAITNNATLDPSRNVCFEV